MSTAVPRFIVVDDVDSSIQYTGPWFSQSNQTTQDSVGNFGPPYQDTLHGANANASFSFPFNGTQIRVIGSNNILNSSGVLDPTWECFIDNISIGVSTPFAYAENNWVFCSQDTLVDGPHVLTVNATVMKNQTFWFDDIQYAPSASVPLDQAAIMVDSLDPQLHYGTGWGPLGNSANVTLVAGSIFTFDFIGVSLSWYGWVPRELPVGPSSAIYSIDGQTPIGFILPGIPVNTSTTYNQKFFETGQYPAGPHTLKVVYEGMSSPLTLDFLIVQNGTSTSTTTSTTQHATSTNSSNGVSGTPTSRKSSTPVGGIIGGVIGGVALIVFVILGFLLLRRRQRSATQREDISTPTPFSYSPLHTSNIAPNSLSGGSAVMYGPKGPVYHASMPSLTSTDASQFIETSSGVTSHPSNLRPAPLQQTALTLANPSLFSPPVLSSVPSPPSSKIERESEALAALRPQRRGELVPVSAQNTPNVVLHADSGIRMPPHTASISVTDVPPIYTPD